ncbi:MAG: amidohydrolase [Gemmatimonadetes bacterium]|nr:MAG: amidohydrolase [Gemmatimonadota bacterium]
MKVPVMAKNKLFINANVYTMDNHQPRAEAIATTGNKIFAVGSNTEILGCGLPQREIINCQGQTLIPGLIDAHSHFLQYGELFFQVDLTQTTDFHQALDQIRAAVENASPGEWITGYGWNKNVWQLGRFPTAADLDAFSPENPILLHGKEGHSIWVNSKAMEIAGVDRHTPDPNNEIMKDTAGNPTGILFEDSRRRIDTLIPSSTPELQEKAIKRAIQESHKLGLVGTQDMSTAKMFSPFPVLQDIYHREGGRGLGFRFWCSITLDMLDAVIDARIRSGFGNEYLRLGGLKQLTDGALGSQTAYMETPYPGTESCGILAIPRDTLKANLKKAAENGICGVVHAIGDRCNREVLEVFEEITRETAHSHNRQNRYFRNRIEHMQCIDPQLLPRVQQLGLISSVQPIHLPGDIATAEQYWPDKLEKTYIFKQIQTAGIPLALGSDVPVETCDPLLGIHAAVTRQRRDGTPEGGWLPAERLQVEDAVRGYTLGAAYASGEEAIKGSLTAGKLADMVLLSQDIFTIEPAGILQTEVTMTVFDGEIVYHA